VVGDVVPAIDLEGAHVNLFDVFDLGDFVVFLFEFVEAIRGRGPPVAPVVVLLEVDVDVDVVCVCVFVCAAVHLFVLVVEGAADTDAAPPDFGRCGCHRYCYCYSYCSW